MNTPLASLLAQASGNEEAAVAAGLMAFLAAFAFVFIAIAVVVVVGMWKTFDKAGLVRLQCEIHDHMKAVILVVDSRYFTTTDAAGKFTLSGLPPGTYTVHAQFDEKAKWSTSVTISPGKTTAADFASNPSVP